MHRFFVPPESIQGDVVQFPRPIAEQMRSVLRLALGEHVIVLLNDGWEHEVQIRAIGKQETSGWLLERRRNQREPRIPVSLYQCLLKKDNFEWVLQKCTEIGVSRFVPVISQRTVVKISDESARTRLDRWGRILTEAAEQSGRGTIPTLPGVMSVADALVDCAAYEARIIAWEQEGAVTLRAALEAQNPASIALFVGPEGGFTVEEVGLAWDYGVTPITLGPRTLRAETAAVVGSALALHTFGELG
jgi:16S rRNA (uracil1498-N3)-methyltransferase